MNDETGKLMNDTSNRDPEYSAPGGLQPPLSNADAHVIADILSWHRAEYRSARTDGVASGTQLATHIERILTTDCSLRHYWNTTVGEWLASRQDIIPPDDTNWDDCLDSIYTQVRTGDSPPHGYLRPIEMPTVLELAPEAYVRPQTTPDR
jgi:hypothetical protein